MGLTDTKIAAAELYKIVLDGNYVASAYFTPHDKNISYNGATYQSIPIKRSNISYHSDLQVDKVDVTFGIVGITIGDDTLTIPQIIERDYLKNAHLCIYLYDWENSVLLSTRFEGYLTGDIIYNQGSITCSFGSILDKLQDKFPKFIYSEFCNHNLFDEYCTLATGDYAFTGICTDGSTNKVIYDDVLLKFVNHPEGYWTKGEIKITSGANINISRTIKQHFDGYVTLNIPLPATVATTDTFRIWPGCDKSGETCAIKWQGNTIDEFKPAVGTDEGYVHAVFYTNNVKSAFGYFLGFRHAFIRFPHVTISEEMIKFTSIKIKFKAESPIAGETPPCNAVIYCVDADDPAAPTSFEEFFALSLTELSQEWNNVEIWKEDEEYYSIDFKDVFESVINRPGWVSGNSIIIVIKMGDDCSASRWYHTITAGDNVCPVLCIEWWGAQISNYANFFGFETIPKPETLYG